MKRLVCFILVLIVWLLSTIYASDTVITSITLTGTQNLISLPCVPILSSPESIFSGYTINNNLKTWIPEEQDYNIFNIANPEEFGGVILGEGYWFTGNADDVISYESLQSGLPTDGIKTDKWLSLPGADDGKNEGGRHIIGCPYNEAVPIANIWFYDGVDMKSWFQATIAGWVGTTLSYWNGSSYEDITFDGYSSVKELEPGKAYWINTNIDKLAMIIIASGNPLPEIDDISVQGIIVLSNFNGDKTTVPVTVELNGYPITLNLDAHGKFTIHEVPNGTYNVRIKASHWLAKMTLGVVVAGNTVMDPVTLVNGDVVDNNEVDFSDINAVRAAYGSFLGDDTWNVLADVDGSGEVDFTDINVVRSNTGEIGD